MKKLVWLNPVVKSIYELAALKKSLQDKGFSVMECEKDHANGVKNAYKNALAQKELIFDSRCPRAVNFIRANFKEQAALISNLNPILIESALELSAKLKEDEWLYVTTPCEDLAELGRGLNLARTTFLTWKSFREQNAINLKMRSIEQSPIPPGFFTNLGVKTLSLGSKEKIQNTLSYKFSELKNYQIIELLYCENGCHNGDGL
ncbi:hypothetical protein [Campylobacter showae]|uniref:Uncharacterized protein n=1 Tax=Campylobacter showae CSUNSWCD TaxID=1244083 RepID=M5ISM7_9BACT|nr:hypothetical protein [Campylobacter showae]EKU11933.1 hypothetical protein CSUNSWCD_1257 [Campylobacter showae CSUNSWCD]